MTEEQKDSIQIGINMLKISLSNSNIIIGALIDKKKPAEAKLIFIDKDQYRKGNLSNAITIEFDEINK